MFTVDASDPVKPPVLCVLATRPLRLTIKQAQLHTLLARYLQLSCSELEQTSSASDASTSPHQYPGPLRQSETKCRTRNSAHLSTPPRPTHGVVPQAVVAVLGLENLPRAMHLCGSACCHVHLQFLGCDMTARGALDHLQTHHLGRCEPCLERVRYRAVNL